MLRLNEEIAAALASSAPAGKIPLKNRQYNSKQIANALITQVVVGEIEDKAVQIQLLLEGILEQQMEMFFSDLTSHMGSQADLASQLPSIPGLRPWVPLSVDYKKRKGNDLYWVYTASPLGSAKSRARAAARTNARTGKSLSKSGIAGAIARDKASALIPKLKAISATRAFGPVTVSIPFNGRGDFTEGSRAKTSFGKDNDKFQRFSTRGTIDVTRYEGGKRMGKNRKQQNYTIPGFALRVPLSFKIYVNLFTATAQSKWSKIESHLVSQGVLDPESRNKLVAKSKGQGGSQRTKPHRPLIRPFMAYYSRIVIPRVIRSFAQGYVGRKFNAANVTTSREVL